MENYFRNYLNAHDEALVNLEITDRGGVLLNQQEGFDKLCEWTQDLQKSGNKQYLVGNGASAAFANHMALDWTKNGGVPTHAFANSALLTAMGNDLGFEEVFSAPLSWYASSGDRLITISSSGNSPNIIKTIEVARAKGMSVITFSGLKLDNASRKLGDLNFYIPAKTYGIVECAHQVLLHIWLDQFMGVKEWEKTEEQNMSKADYRL